MITPTELAQLKQISIADYLAQQGHQPVQVHGSELTYYSPFRQEKTPSFRVSLAKNAFKDFGDDELKGDLIRLVQLLHQCTFLTAIEKLQEFGSQPAKTSFSFSGQIVSEGNDSPTEITAVKPLQHPALLRYCQERGISVLTAYQYLKEVHYRNQGGQFFAVGFANEKGGYELRAKIGKEVKLCTSKALTVFEVPGAKAVNVFEGFFDFLSAVEYYQARRPAHTTIVLNSTSLVKQAIPLLRNYRYAYTYLDNDEAGRKAVNQLKRNFINVEDRSRLYYPHKDFNEFWLGLQQPPSM